MSIQCRKFSQSMENQITDLKNLTFINRGDNILYRCILQNWLIPKSQANSYKPNHTFIPMGEGGKHWSRFTLVNAINFLNSYIYTAKEPLRNNGKNHFKIKQLPYHKTCSIWSIIKVRRHTLGIVCLLENGSFLHFLYAKYSETPCLYDQI